MGKRVKMDEIVNCALEAIDKAHKDYHKWSNGEWLWNAPEYFLTVRIAEKIAKLDKNKFVTMEDNVDYILDEAKAKKSGDIHPDIRADGRFDIVLWWASCEPRAIIEVKNGVNAYIKIQEDISRVSRTIKDAPIGSKIQFGLIAFYTSHQYKKGYAIERLDEQIHKIFNSAKDGVGEIGKELKLEGYWQDMIKCDDNINAYSPVVFLIKQTKFST